MGIFRCNKSNKCNNFKNNCSLNGCKSYPQNNYCNNSSSYGNKANFNFSQKKENTICSLREVECFLCNCQKALKCFKFYCFFK